MAGDVSAQLHHVEGDIDMNDKCNILYSAVLILLSDHFSYTQQPFCTEGAPHRQRKTADGLSP